MKLTSYTIYFKGGPITVQAFNYKEAKILAQAEAIKRGWDYTILDKHWPKEFNFKSNINDLVSMYHAVETEDDYIVTCDSGSLWHFGKDEMHSRLKNGDYVIVKEERNEQT